MAKYFDVHPVDPQPRAIGQAVEILRTGGLIAYQGGEGPFGFKPDELGAAIARLARTSSTRPSGENGVSSVESHGAP